MNKKTQIPSFFLLSLSLSLFLPTFFLQFHLLLAHIGRFEAIEEIPSIWECNINGLKSFQLHVQRDSTYWYILI